MAEDKVAVGKNTVYGIVIVSLVVLILLSIVTGGFAGTQGKGATPQAKGTAPPAGTAAQITALMDDDMKIGSDSAPVVIVEFSDFQCPFCRKWFIETYPSIKRDYIDTGKAQLVFRDFPLSFHPSAMKAAQAVECADDEGKGWQMHDKIYSEQAKQGPGTVQFTVDDLKRWASEIGLGAAFNGCLDSGKCSGEVQADFSDGSAAGVQGTPSFIIAGRDGSVAVPLSGAQPYATFQNTIDQILQ